MRTPPLNAVKTFESAGRHLSFTLAARDLNVTVGAVSRQIKLLEEYLGTSLFERDNRELHLTKVGRRYLEAVSDALGQIRAATDEIMTLPENQRIRVSSSLTFVFHWLMPRLLSYHALHPEVDVQFSTSLAPVDFRRDELDLAIRMGHAGTRHAIIQPLFRSELVAICGPALLRGDNPLTRIEDLRNHTLLHTSARPTNWNVWLTAVGHPDLEGAHNLFFESSSLVYQAAAEGIGVAIAQIPLVTEELSTGKLVAPFPVTVLDNDDYNLIWPDNVSRNKVLSGFIDWMLSEAKKTAAVTEKIKSALGSGKV